MYIKNGYQNKIDFSRWCISFDIIFNCFNQLYFPRGAQGIKGN